MLGVAGALAAGQGVVTLEVEHDHVTAADLARIMPQWGEAPGETEVLYAPAPGLARDLLASEIARLAARCGVSPDPSGRWPERVRLSRRMRRLESTEAAAALAEVLARRYRISPEDIGVELVGFQAPAVPAGELRFRAGEAFHRPGELVTMPLVWVSGDGRSGTLWLRARLGVRERYAVAARAIEPRSLIGPADLVLREGEIDSPPDRWVLEPAQAVGKTLARRVAAGEKIPRGFLIAPKTIERGAVVELRLARGPIELRVPGRAEQSGSVGERLAFRNLTTGRRVTGQLADAHSAEVILTKDAPSNDAAGGKQAGGKQ